MSQSQVQTLTQSVGSIALRGSREPIKRNGALDKFDSFLSTTVIGQEFSKDVQLSQLLKAENADELLKDLAVLVSERGVVFFRGQDLDHVDEQKLIQKLGELSGKPASSKLHVHPYLTVEPGQKGDYISEINSSRRAEYFRGDRSRLASTGWHSDITFEKAPSDYATLKIHTAPPTGGDTLWASGYEVYDRLSPPFAKFLEGLSAFHDGSFFHVANKQSGQQFREAIERGSPLNKGDDLTAVHPVIRTNPVTGFKSVFVNPGFTKRILGVTKDESDQILNILFSLINQNHDLQVRFRWTPVNAPGIGDVAIWDNRSTYHTATYDYFSESRVGDRAVSIGESPYYDENSKSRRAALGLPRHGE